MRSIRFVSYVFVLIMILTTNSLCWGAPALALVGRGDGSYELMAQGLEKVKNIDLTITYDPSTLTTPRIKQGALVYGAMMMPDFSSPGIIRVTLISSVPQGIKGNGSIGMLTFARTTAGAGQVVSFTASLVSTNGGALALATPQILTGDNGRFDGDPFQGKLDATSGTLAETIVTGKPSSTPEVSILSLFKDYSGKKITVQELTALFSHHDYPGFRQEPPIALSDGTSTIYVYVTPQSHSEQSLNFALTGAKQVSLKKTGAGYVLGLIPDAGAYEASVMLMNQGRVIEYPLVVAPPARPGMISDGMGEQTAFTRFLQDYAEGKGDANNDGNTDYRDLYFYTANYLARKNVVIPSTTGVAKVSAPVVSPPVVATPVVSQPVVSQPVSSQPQSAVSQPVVSQPVSSPPVSSPPVVSQLSVSQSVLTQPQPVVSQPVVSQPVSSPPVVATIKAASIVAPVVATAVAALPVKSPVALSTMGIVQPAPHLVSNSNKKSLVAAQSIGSPSLEDLLDVSVVPPKRKTSQVVATTVKFARATNADIKTAKSVPQAKPVVKKIKNASAVVKTKQVKNSKKEKKKSD